MLNLVITFRLTGNNRPVNWSSFWRAVLTDKKPGAEFPDNLRTNPHGTWDLLACTNPSRGKTGAWVYKPRTGELMIRDSELHPQEEEGQTVILFGVHWNFRVICSHTPLTGKGRLPKRPPKDQDIAWVIGPGIAPASTQRVEPVSNYPAMDEWHMNEAGTRVLAHSGIF